jgi:hypothetical protein
MLHGDQKQGIQRARVTRDIFPDIRPMAWARLHESNTKHKTYPPLGVRLLGADTVRIRCGLKVGGMPVTYDR